MFLLVLTLPLMSAVTLNPPTNLTSSGLNSTIVIDDFVIYALEVTVDANYIYFSNMNYTHPEACAGDISFMSWNFTEANTTYSDLDLPHTKCGHTPNEGEGATPTETEETTTETPSETEDKNIIEKIEDTFDNISDEVSQRLGITEEGEDGAEWVTVLIVLIFIMFVAMIFGRASRNNNNNRR